MALPDYMKVEQGAAVVLGEDGYAGVTHTLALDALADGVARMSDVVDLGAQWDELQAVMIIAETGAAAPAATGVRLDLYVGCSNVAGVYPGGVTGTDGTWPTDSNEDEWALQLQYIGCLVATADANVVQVQSAKIWQPAGRYCVFVADNNLGVALRDYTPNSGNSSRIIVSPLRGLIQDAA